MIEIDFATPVTWASGLTAVASSAAILFSVIVAVVEASRAGTARRERNRVLDEQRESEHKSTARLVSAWVEQGYMPSSDGTNYGARAVVHIINEAEVPVFRVAPCVEKIPIGEDANPILLGPLSMPQTISVLPPRRELTYDVSIPLLPHRTSEHGGAPEFGASIAFTDPENVRWSREADGQLDELKGTGGRVFTPMDDTQVAEQVGEASPINPLPVALAFLHTISDATLSEDEALDQLRNLVAPEASGWNGLDRDALRGMRDELKDFNVGTQVQYPVPNVAYVKVIDETATQLTVTRPGNVVVPVRMITLTFTPERDGWRVFSWGGGGTPPDRILFPPGTLDW